MFNFINRGLFCGGGGLSGVARVFLLAITSGKESGGADDNSTDHQTV